MKAKLTRVPFDAEMAKRIQSGEIEGKILTIDGRNARIICFDANTPNGCIIALVANSGDNEIALNYLKDGSRIGESLAGLMLEIPEYMTFKEGDLIAYENGDLVLFKAHILNMKYYQRYAVLSNSSLEFGTSACMIYDGTQLANEEKRQVFINALKSSEYPIAKKYLKRFFGIEEKKECEFKPFDKVLVRDSDEDIWHANFFSNMTENKDFTYRCPNSVYKYCIHYNEQTAHLLGTTDNYEE